jgi:Protein of unknown function (DUF3617)
MTKRLAAIVLVAGSFIALVAAEGPRRDGEWEVKMEMNMPGMPIAIPPTTTKQCITPTDASDPKKALPPQGRGGNASNCTVSDYKIEGNTVSWSMACSGSQPMTGKGQFVYEQSAYTGTMIMDMQGRGTMTMKYSGKRLGDCTK